ncbi:hypothetical protein R1flu_025183 [Riccia fluitans]|uniref:Centrosomal protein of 70 kDa n=1 Tax=Riccia fluitans TaxID=41844 RepID=A0ABD1XX17_9MARC
MEDLAHFIQSMSEKYGLLDGIESKKEPGESHGLAGGKQITDRPSSAASNSCNNINEVSSGQASSWEYLSVFVTRQAIDTKRPSPLPLLQSEGNSHLHAYARMIDINKEPEPESPLPTTSQVVLKESGDIGEKFVEIDSLPEGENVGKDFSDVVTMSDNIQGVYGSKESGGKHQLTDYETLDEPCQLGERNNRQNSASSLQFSHRRDVLCHPRELDDYPQSRISSCRSDHPEEETAASVVEDRQVKQHGAECSVTTTAGDLNDQYGTCTSTGQPNYEKHQIWKPVSTSSSSSLSASAGGGQAQPQVRKHRGVVSSFVILDNEVEFGENVALHDYAVSSGESSSRSYCTEGAAADQDVHKRQDERSRTPMDEYSDHHLASVSSNVHHDEQQEKEAERENRPLSNGQRQAQHKSSRSLEKQERGTGPFHGKYYTWEEEGNFLEDEQAHEGELASGFEFIGTEVSSGLELGDTAATLSTPMQKGKQRVRNEGSESELELKKGNSKHGGSHQDIVDLTQDLLQETETTKTSLNQRSKTPIGTQQSLKTSKVTEKEREQRDRRGNWDDVEEQITFLSHEHTSHQNLLTDREQERPPRGISSSRAQGACKDSFHLLDEEERTNNCGGGYSKLRANNIEYRCDDSGEHEIQAPGDQEMQRHAVNQHKVETDHRQKRKERGHPQGKRSNHRETKHMLAENYSKVEDLLSSILALSNNDVNDRSTLLDKVTSRLIAETETRNIPENSILEAPFMKAKTSADSARVGEETHPREKSGANSRQKNHELETRRQQSAGFTADASGPWTVDEARFFENWDLGEDLSLLPSRASWESESVNAKWTYINKILCDNGFSPLNSSSMNVTHETIDKLLDSLGDVVRNYSRREKLVQELLAERDSLRQEEERNDQVTLKLETQVETLKQKLAACEQRAELAAAASEKNIASLRKEHQRLEGTHASTLQRCSQLEHVCRAKERSLRKLQEKISEAVTRENSQRTRDKELYDKLKHKVAISQKAQGEIVESNFLLRDMKPAAIVGIYERQRAASEAEMNQLREENARLCKELREKENSLLSKAMSAVDADQAELDQREQDLIQQLTEVLEIQQVGSDCFGMLNIGF